VRVRVPPSALNKLKLKFMNTVIGVLFILVILICVISMTITAAVKYEIERYRNYINNRTKFVCKESPDITCTIDYIYWEDIENIRMVLNVTYPEGYTSSLLTTIGIFNYIWEEKLDE
jgi:hypothetical protein